MKRGWGRHSRDIDFGRLKKEPVKTTILENPNINTWAKAGRRFRATVPKINEQTLRRFARTAIPRRAINIVIDGVLGRGHIVEKRNPLDKADYTRAIQAVETVVTTPNNQDDYYEFWGAILEDTMSGDCGCFEKARAGDIDRPLFLFPVNGFTIEFCQGYRDNPDIPRFAQNQGIKKEYFTDNELAYLKIRNFTNTPFGCSPLEAAFTYISYLLDVQEYSNLVASKSVPKFILNLGKNIDQSILDQYRRYFEEEIYGSGDTPIISGDGSSSVQIAAINDDGLFLKYQQFLISIIAFTFGIPPSKLGQEVSNDKSTITEKNENVLEEAVKPYAKLLERAINKHVINNIGLGKYLQFRFIFEETLAQQEQRSKIDREDWNADLYLMEEIRAKKSLPPFRDERDKMTISEYKAWLNQKYPSQNGGFNGVGKNRHAEGGEND